MPNELHTMPLKVEKFISSASVRMMRWDEKGAYLLLLAEAWLNGGRLPNDPEKVRRLLGVSDDATWKRLEKFVLNAMFHPSEDGKFLENSALTQIYAETLKTRERFAEAGRKGMQSRWEKTDNQVITTLSQGYNNQRQRQRQNQNKTIDIDGPDGTDGPDCTDGEMQRHSPSEPSPSDFYSQNFDEPSPSEPSPSAAGAQRRGTLLNAWIRSGRGRDEYERLTARLPELSPNDIDCLKAAGVNIEGAQLSYLRRAKALLGVGIFHTLCRELQKWVAEGKPIKKNTSALLAAWIAVGICHKNGKAEPMG